MTGATAITVDLSGVIDAIVDGVVHQLADRYGLTESGDRSGYQYDPDLDTKAVTFGEVTE
jgi:hypothetical protein